jgi:Lrp/AsnC family leucine-responsive transcriptional regulator
MLDHLFVVPTHKRVACVKAITQDRKSVEKVDVDVLRILQKDCRVPLREIAEQLGVPKSTVHYRVRRLEQAGIIEGYYAKLNAAALGNEYLAVILVRAKYGPRYHERVGRRLAKVAGVSAVFYVLGEIDFIVLIRAIDTDDYMRKLTQISNMRDIERTSTQVVAKILKEDPRVDL